MKRHIRSLLCLALLVASAAAYADSAPAVDIHRAIAIAEKSLANRGLTGKVYVASATLERSSVFNNHSYWFIQWSQTLPGDEKGQSEVGVKVQLDGTATRLVKAPH
ncbi:MAG: hypothetical protein QM796_12860 [Chthoniobacteraceae bacterium]